LCSDYTNIYSEGDFQHVQIDDITLEHRGRYHVEAFNQYGVVSSHFTLIVDNGLDRYMPPFFTRELRQAQAATETIGGLGSTR
jgi:hypothetical protein